MTTKSTFFTRIGTWVRNPFQAFRDTSLSVKLILLFLAVTLAIAVPVSIITIRGTTVALTEQVGEGLVAVAETLGQNVGTVLAQRVETMQAFAQDPELLAALAAQNDTYTGDAAAIEAELLKLDDQWVAASDDDELVSGRLESDLAHEMDNVVVVVPDFAEVFVTDRYGGLVAASDRTSDYYQADEGWWQAAYNEGQGGVFIAEPEVDESAGVIGIDMAVPVYATGSDEIIGVLRTTLDATTLLAEFQVEIGKTGEVDIVFPSGNVMGVGGGTHAVGEAHEHTLDPAMLEQLYADPHGHIDAAYEEISSLISRGAVTSVRDEKFISGLGWNIVVHQAKDEALAPVNQTRNTTIITVIIIGFLADVIAIFVGRAVANPILKLTEAVKRFATGDRSVRTESKSADEIGTLTNSFNTMAEEVDTLMTDIETRSEELAERTRELEASQRVTFAASERVTPDELLDLVVNLIRDQFDLYHAQVYLVDKEENAAVLKQSTGYAGRQLLTRRHKIPLDATSLVTTAIHTGEPVLVEDTAQDPNFMANPLLPETKSELVVPLKLKDEIIGVMDAQDRTPDRFGPSTVDLFQSMADQVAILFENSELLGRISEQTESLTIFTNQLRTAAEIARRMGSILDPERLLEQTVEMLQSRFGLYHAHIYVVDETTKRLVMRSGSGEVGRVLRKQNHAISLDAEKSLVARAARGEQPVLVNDTSQESDFMPNPLLPQTRSEVAIPLISGDKVMGVLDIQDDQPDRFSETDIDTFGTLAGQIGTALQTAGVFEQTRLRLQVSQALTNAQTEDEVLDVLIRQAGIYPEAQVMILTFDDEAGERFSTVRGIDSFDSTLSPPFQPGVRFPNSQFPLSQHFSPTEPFVTANTQTDERLDPGSQAVSKQTGAMSLAVIPVTAGNEWLGLILAEAKPEGHFDEQKLQLYSTLAEQGATALQIARLNDNVQNSLKETQVRLGVSQALTTAQTEVEVLDALIGQAGIYPEAQIQIITFDGEADERFSNVRRIDPFDSTLTPPFKVGMRFPNTQFPVMQYLSPDEPFVSANMLTDERIDPASRELPKQTGAMSLAVTPITAGNEWLGLILADAKPEGYFDEQKVQLYQTLAEQGATALQIARLSDSVQNSLKETQVRLDVSQALAAAQTEGDVMDMLIQKAGLYPQAMAMIFLDEYEGEEAYTVAHRIEAFESGLPSMLEPGTRFPAAQFAAITQHESERGEFISANVHTDERVDDLTREMSKQMGTVSMALLPFGTRDQKLGSLSLSSREEGYFDEQKLQLYRALVEQGATALQVARLNDEALEREARFTGFAEASGYGFGMGELTGQLTFANPALLELLGEESQESACQKTFFEYYTDEDRKRMEEEVLPAVMEKGQWVGEIPILSSKGKLTPTEQNVFLIYDDQGNPRMVANILTDITERKQAQEEMQKLATVVTHSSELVNLATLEGQMTFVNAAGSRMLGIDPEDIEQYAIPHVIPEEMMPMVQGELLPTLMSEGAWEGELQYKNVKTGEITDAHASTFIVTDPESGEPLYLANVSMDITERKRFTNQLRTAAELAEQINAELDPDQVLNQVVNQLHDRFDLYHVHVYTLAEPTPEKLANADADEVARIMRERPLTLRAGSGEVGEKLLKKGHAIALHTEKSLVARAARDRTPVLVNDTSEDPDFLPNPLLPETRSEVAVPLVAGENVLGVLDVQDNQPERFTQSDIDVLVTMAGQIATALQNASYFEEVQRTAERLREVDRLKSEFLASMSHELRTPLNSIIGYTEIMLMGLDTELDPEMTEDVQAIYDNGQHLLRIINDVLDLAKIEAGRLELNQEEVPVEVLIDAASSSVTGLLVNKEKPVEFKVEVEDDLPTIQGDQVRLNQVINNLASNAVKFTDEGHITLRAFRDDGWICLEVEDTGIGIAKEDISKIFERFQQVDGSNARQQEGTGLGLAITRHLVEMHGGSIKVKSELGKGSTFTVRLPSKSNGAEEAAPEALQESAAPKKAKSRKKRAKKAKPPAAADAGATASGVALSSSDVVDILLE